MPINTPKWGWNSSSLSQINRNPKILLNIISGYSLLQIKEVGKFLKSRESENISEEDKSKLLIKIWNRESILYTNREETKRSIKSIL